MNPVDTLGYARHANARMGAGCQLRLQFGVGEQQQGGAPPFNMSRTCTLPNSQSPVLMRSVQHKLVPLSSA